MENYSKGESRKIYDPPNLQKDGVIEMKVTAGSKLRNLLGYAIPAINNPEARYITWNGTGNGIQKAISCTEILKRKVKGLHQITQIGYMRVEDNWIPKIDGLDILKVNTNVPAISILLSKDPLDSNDSSYQAPGVEGIVWAGEANKQHQKSRSEKSAAAVRNLKSAASKPKRQRGDNRRDNTKKSSGKKQAASTHQQDQGGDK